LFYRRHSERSEESLYLPLSLLVILSAAKNRRISRGERSDPSAYSQALQNKSHETAKSTAPKKRMSANHLYHAFHHALSTKKPRLQLNFPESRSKKHTRKNQHQNQTRSKEKWDT